MRREGQPPPHLARELPVHPEVPRKIQVAVIPIYRDLNNPLNPWLLTIRQARGGITSIEFPGGTMEEQDEQSMRETAYRELGEETGLPRDKVTLLIPAVAAGTHVDPSTGESADYSFLLGILQERVSLKDLYHGQSLQLHERIGLGYIRLSVLQGMDGKEMVEPRSRHALAALLVEEEKRNGYLNTYRESYRSLVEKLPQPDQDGDAA